MEEGEDIKVGCTMNESSFGVQSGICSHIDIVFRFQLKPESEYPDWLWEIHTGPPKKLEELDPNTKEYWRRVRKTAFRQHNRLEKTKRRHLY